MLLSLVSWTGKPEVSMKVDISFESSILPTPHSELIHNECISHTLRRKDETSRMRTGHLASYAEAKINEVAQSMAASLASLRDCSVSDRTDTCQQFFSWSNHLSANLTLFWSLTFSVCLYACLSVSICLLVCVFVFLSTCLSVCVVVSLSVVCRLSTSVWLSPTSLGH